MRIGKYRIKTFFAKNDLWVGAYFCRRSVYICPIPCCVIKVWEDPDYHTGKKMQVRTSFQPCKIYDGPDFCYKEVGALAEGEIVWVVGEENMRGSAIFCRIGNYRWVSRDWLEEPRV